VLPAFKGARRNSKLVALVSDDATKLQALGRQYDVDRLYSYEEYESCLQEVDAVFIALPNSLHREYTERAAAAGVHVLCEKPMAMTEEDCQAMIESCRRAGVRLMLGYRLHFEKANLRAVELIQSGELGEPRLFGSVFSTDVEPGNVRLRAGEGGPLYDIGIYCVNAARYLFRAEPEEVLASHARRKDARFVDTPEMTTAVLRFPDDRLATFSCSFGAAHVGTYWIVGTEASLRVDPAYSIGTDLVHHFTRKGRTRSETFKARDQFAAELLYFSDCLPEDREPEPSGEEGLADVRVLRAIERSAEDGRSVKLGPFERRQRPTPAQEISRPLGPRPEAEAHSRGGPESRQVMGHEDERRRMDGPPIVDRCWRPAVPSRARPLSRAPRAAPGEADWDGEERGS
jgi:glucose-fructose oxidoreductase